MTYACTCTLYMYMQESEGHGSAVVLRADTVLFTSLVDTLLHCCQKHRGKEVYIHTIQT